MNGTQISTPDVDVRTDRDGVLYVRDRRALDAWPDRITEWLDRWADDAPDRPFLVERDATGSWAAVTYAGARARVRRLAQALLDRRLSVERPVLILSGNSVE